MSFVSEDQYTSIENPSTPWRRRLGTLVLILTLVLVIAFSVRVFNYYHQIQTGQLDVTGLSFQRTNLTANQLIKIAQASPGSGELATVDDPSLGNSDVKLTIVEFADFGCPFSAQESYVVRALGQKFAGQIQIIYRDFPLVDLHPGADLAAEAADCADVQGKFWEYHDVLYRNSGDFSVESLVDYANQVGLNVKSFQTCLETGEFTHEVAQDLSDGVAAGVTGTPTFFLNGQKIEGAIPFSTFTEIVEAFLAE